MPAVHIRDVPQPVLAGLKERAERHGRSLQQELKDILTRASTERGPAETRPAPALRTVRTSGTSTWGREEIYGDDAR